VYPFGQEVQVPFGLPHTSFIGYPIALPCPGHAGLGLREVRPADGEEVLAHLLGLSAIDRHNRFCGGLSDEALGRHVAEMQARNSFAIGAFEGPLWSGPFHRAGPIRALIEVVIAGKDAEFGLSVESARRRSGIGTYLVQTAAHLIAHRGVERLLAFTLPGNAAMIGLGRALGAEIATEGGETLLTFSVAALEAAYLRRRIAAQVRLPLGRAS
jgi:GNAT superfamily N-acetyltransferase